MNTFITADPHPAYARWRAEGPIRQVPLPGGEQVWLVTEYETGRQALADPRLSKAPRDAGSYSETDRALNMHMLSADPPDHTRLRKLLSGAFTSRRIESLRPRVEQITDTLLDEMSAHEQADLLNAFTVPLPIQVICELLGIPDADRDTFRVWSGHIVAGVDPTGEVTSQTLQSTTTAFLAYIRDLLRQRRTRLGDDLLSGLIAVRDDEDRLSEDELTSMVFMLLIAGTETTANLLGNGSFLLLSERERWERLRLGRELLPEAIEEFLRYESSLKFSTGRIAAEDFELAGAPIRAGDVVMVSLLAVNRDPSRFDSPGELRLSRTPNSHLAFGHGIHRCIGAPLARMEAMIAFDRLLTRFPRLRLAVPAEQVTWRPRLLIRGLDALPVHTGARR
ncbi:cytochrome P450 family protein [Actinoplanes sp. RD1]|uniref:cytochrome P450 family protein n=1 Tax=Actinoplanes sp. RD1 TaxID=3064538 RepID=UPI002741DCF4|nr:cytochrome P450 [Actinoplanes sp. RD1]